MFKRRILSSSYLGAGLAIATGVTLNLGSALPARAQADLNLQSRLETIMPPVGPQLPAGNGATAAQALAQAITPEEKKNTLLKLLDSNCALSPNLKTVAANITALRAKNTGPEVQQSASDVVKEFLKGGASDLLSEDKEQKEQLIAKILAAINPNCTIRQPQTVQITLPFNPSYETNILRSRGNNNSPGDSAGFGGQVQVVTGVERRPWDLVILNAQEASTRYTPNASPSTDGLSQQASYQMFLHAYGYDVSTKTFVDNLVPGSPNPPLPAGTTTFDTLTFGVLNQTGFVPTFKTEKSDFLTPQVSLARQNIGLDDLTGKPCVTANQKFCYYANLSFAAGQTFSDVISSENVNFAASATLGWNITSEWSLTLPATATAKDYEHVVGGRRDLQLQVGPVLAFSSANKINLHCPTPNPNKPKPDDYCEDHEDISYTFKLPISYYKNYSTLSTAAWSGWVIMPTLSISFNWQELVKPKS